MTLVSTPAANAVKPARLAYRPQLDGLRGMAVIAVFLYHAEQFGFSGGFLGVDLFFVLSGYLITRLLIEEHDSTSTVKLAEFWARRIRRLLPAMLVMLITVVIVWPTFGGRSLGGDAFGVLFYVANWRFISESQSYFADISASSPLQHTQRQASKQGWMTGRLNSSVAENSLPACRSMATISKSLSTKSTAIQSRHCASAATSRPHVVVVQFSSAASADVITRVELLSP